MKVMETALKYRKYTCEEIDGWDTDERYELIDGDLYLMAAPKRIHQKISGALFLQLGYFLKGKSCEAYTAPFAVRLYRDAYTRVEPDIAVICDKSKLTDEGCSGAPDLIIEILSPSSQNHDRIKKYDLYLKAGVREYWIVDSDNKTVTVYILKNGEYDTGNYSETAVVPVHVLNGCVIDLNEVFAEQA